MPDCPPDEKAGDGGLTTREHHARAMFMGWYYMKEGHYYYGVDPDNPNSCWGRWDADTLEPLTADEAGVRLGP